jgi:hypothetical protein
VDQGVWQRHVCFDAPLGVVGWCVGCGCVADACTTVFASGQGTKFTVENLLGPEFADIALDYAGGSLMISRLAPQVCLAASDGIALATHCVLNRATDCIVQDYHRWHMPVSGREVRRVALSGALFTVNPVSVRGHINVYTENKRVVSGATSIYGYCPSLSLSLTGCCRRFSIDAGERD